MTDTNPQAPTPEQHAKMVEAFKQIVEALEPLEPEAQLRVIRAVAIICDIETKP